MMLNQWIAEQMVDQVSAERRRASHRGTGPTVTPTRSAGAPGPGRRMRSPVTRRLGELLIAAGSRLAGPERSATGRTAAGLATSDARC